MLEKSNYEDKLLISIKTYSTHADKLLKAAVLTVQKNLKVLRISSVYSVKGRLSHSTEIHDLRTVEYFEGLAVVLECEASDSAENLLDWLQLAETELSDELLKRSVSMNLLFYGYQRSSLPHLCLPHPEAHRHPEELVLAAELWGQYKHPVLGQRLADLSQKFGGAVWGEFYAQGKALLDF